MPEFSQSSKDKLATCHPKLQQLFHEAIQTMDMTIVTGYRGQVEQDQAFADGRSKLQFPHGKHNQMPSLAVDACPFPYDWSTDQPPIKLLAEHIKATAQRLGVDITWGGDWVGFPDTDHFQLDFKTC
jgi:peptidoglycan L-alanyl-D-glutamate endopeptidase CwlK